MSELNETNIFLMMHAVIIRIRVLVRRRCSVISLSFPYLSVTYAVNIRTITERFRMGLPLI